MTLDDIVLVAEAKVDDTNKGSPWLSGFGWLRIVNTVVIIAVLLRWYSGRTARPKEPDGHE